jgi:hypothetical protein
LNLRRAFADIQFPRSAAFGLCLTGALASCRGAHSPPGAPSPPLPDPSATGAAATPQCPDGWKSVWRGDLAQQDWLHAWDANAKVSHGQGNAEVVSEPHFGHVLRVHYPAGSSSSSYAKKGHPEGGLEFTAALPSPGVDRIFLSYWIRFADGFQWIRGGKLPGLCGGTCPSGGADVSGFGGWSMRYMWRPGGDGEQYAYVLPPKAYGTELGLGAWTFTKGSWHRIAEELLLNSNGAANGISRVWYDADLSRSPTFEEANMTFRRDATPATTVFFSTFFGGHDSSWATPVDTFVDFADFVVCE